MTEPFLIAERIKLGASLSESHFREFKSGIHGPPSNKRPRAVRGICEDIALTLVAFANADGGELYVGVEDDGTITGLNDHDQSAIAEMLLAPKTHVMKGTPLPGVGSQHVSLDGKSVLFFKVARSDEHIFQTADGKCVQRRDLETIPISAEQVRYDRQEAKSRHYDRSFIDGATMAALDERLLDIVTEQVMPGIHREKCLQLLDLAEYTDAGLRLRRAALLLFAKEPQRWHPRLQVRILRVQGTEVGSGESYNVAVDEVVTEPILSIIDAAWDRLRPHLVQTRFSPDGRFQTTYIYPELACREALVNAVAHRDYTQEGRGIEIYVFDDRMEVQSPGSLLSSVKIEDLKKLEGVHQSRNSLIARVLTEVGHMRELGEGLRRIFELMKGNELMEPDLRNGPDHFSITLHHQQMYTPAERAWLDQFSGITLNRNQRAVIVLGRGGRLIAPQDITDSLGLVDWDEYRQVVSSLQELGIIESALTQNQVFRKMGEAGMPRRRVPRWKIRVPASNVPPVGAAIAKRESSLSASATLAKSDLPAPLSRELFVQDIPYRTNYKNLLRFFEQFGAVSELRVPKGLGGTRGYCFLNYEEQAAANACFSAAEKGTLQFEDRRLRITPALPRKVV